jgi:hypothetical protein
LGGTQSGGRRKGVIRDVANFHPSQNWAERETELKKDFLQEILYKK